MGSIEKGNGIRREREREREQQEEGKEIDCDQLDRRQEECMGMRIGEDQSNRTNAENFPLLPLPLSASLGLPGDRIERSPVLYERVQGGFNPFNPITLYT